MAEKSAPREDYATTVARTFAEAIAAGTAPWQKPWAPGELSAAYNPTTDKPYRGFNQTWLSLQPYGDPRWMTYKQAEALDAQVRKGENGTTIEYWQWTVDRPVKDARGKPIMGDDGKPRTQTVELESPRRFYARVFNAEQIDGLQPLPARAAAPEWERHQQAEAVIRNSPAGIRHVQGDSAYYMIGADRITLPLREQFETPDLYYATAFHEIAHSSGHPSRLDRDMAHPFGSEGYAREELVAEISSFMMAQRLGMAFDPGQHHSYVGGWLRALEKDPREIFRAAAAAEKAMDFVIGLSLERTQEVAHERYLIDRATMIGADREAALEADSFARRLGFGLSELAVDVSGAGLEVSEWEAAIAGSSALTSVRADMALAAARSPAHAFLVGAAIYQHLGTAHTLADHFAPPGVPAAAELAERIDGYDRQMRVEGLGVDPASPKLGAWLPADLAADDFRKETAVLGLTEQQQTAALLLGRDIARALESVVSHDLPMATELTTPYEDLLAFAQRSEAQMVAASHVLNLALNVDGDATRARLRPDWALAAALVEDRINDIRLGLHEAEEREAALEQAARRPIESQERAADLSADATINPDDAAAILSKEYAMTGDEMSAPGNGARLDLTVPFAEKNAAKRAGAKWDKIGKTWYAPAGLDPAAVAAWVPSNQTPTIALTPHEEFKTVCESYGLIMDKLPVMDGKWHRVPVGDDQKSGQGNYIEKSGAYRAFDKDADPRGHPAGVVKNNRSGRGENWKYSGQVAEKLSAADRAKLEREQAEKQTARAAERLAAHQAVADLVLQIIDQASPVSADHPYLVRKDITDDRIRMMDGAVDFPPGSDDPQRFGGKDHLLIPVHDLDGKVWGVQAISPNGKKSFPRGARKEGLHHLIGDVNNGRPVLLVEGYATGRDLHLETTYPVAVCFDAGNLAKVAQEFRDRYPGRLLVIAGDNDHAKERQIDPTTNQPKPNVGKEKALSTAAAVGGFALLPAFQPDDKGSDWNDLRATQGREAQLNQLREGMQIAIRRHKAAELTRTGEGGRIRAEDRVRDQRREREGPELDPRDRQDERLPERALATGLAR